MNDQHKLAEAMARQMTANQPVMDMFAVILAELKAIRAAIERNDVRYELLNELEDHRRMAILPGQRGLMGTEGAGGPYNEERDHKPHTDRDGGEK